MKKRFLSILLAAAVTAALLGGCASGETSGGKRKDRDDPKKTVSTEKKPFAGKIKDPMDLTQYFGDSGDSGSSGDSGDSDFDLSRNASWSSSQGLEMFNTDYFTLSLPMDNEFPEFYGWDATFYGTDTVVFTCDYVTEQGYGGVFLTIRAYDLDDTSYTDLPSAIPLAQDDRKVYVAIFPTDVQYDTEDYDQMLAYTHFSDLVKNIGDADQFMFWLNQ